MGKRNLFILMLLSTMIFTGCSEEETEGTIEKDKEVIEDVIIEEDPNMVIEFPDEELERYIRNLISKESGEITLTDLEEIEIININYEEYMVTNLTGIEYAINLENFSFRNGINLESLSQISNLENLSRITISYTTIKENPEKFNTPLVYNVSFIDTNIQDYSFLEDLTEMTDLYISDTGIQSIEFIEKMDKLEALNLIRNDISDISPIEGKTNLIDISFHMNQITDIDALSSCSNLVTINLSYNHVETVEGLYGLENLSQLTIYEYLDALLVPRTQFDYLTDKGINVLYH